MGWWRDFWLGPTEATQERGDVFLVSPPQGSGVMPPPRSDRIDTVSADLALGLDAVYRAFQLIATALGQLSLDVMRNGAEITAPTFVRQPDVNSTPHAFMEETAISLAANGNAFWRVYRSADSGNISNLEVLNPLDVDISVDSNTGVRSYAYRSSKLTSRQIQHLSLLRVPGRLRGLGPIQAAQESLRGAVELRQYSANWFTGGDVPSGVLKTDQPLSPDQATSYKERWQESQGGRRGVAVLGQGLDYRPVLLSPSEAQFLESQQFTVTSLARLFGIPPHLMLAAVEGQSQTYVNVAQADLSFVRWTLTRYTGEIEAAMTALLPRGQQAKFNLDAILRPDTITRYQAHEIALRNKWLDVDEVRAIEGLGPRNGGSDE